MLTSLCNEYPMFLILYSENIFSENGFIGVQ